MVGFTTEEQVLGSGLWRGRQLALFIFNHDMETEGDWGGRTRAGKRHFWNLPRSLAMKRCALLGRKQITEGAEVRQAGL